MEKKIQNKKYVNVTFRGSNAKYTYVNVSDIDLEVGDVAVIDQALIGSANPDFRCVNVVGFTEKKPMQLKPLICKVDVSKYFESLEEIIDARNKERDLKNLIAKKADEALNVFYDSEEYRDIQKQLDELKGIKWEHA